LRADSCIHSSISTNIEENNLGKKYSGNIQKIFWETDIWGMEAGI
jgi:hypothetical protein